MVRLRRRGFFVKCTSVIWLLVAAACSNKNPLAAASYNECALQAAMSEITAKSDVEAACRRKFERDVRTAMKVVAPEGSNDIGLINVSRDIVTQVEIRASSKGPVSIRQTWIEPGRVEYFSEPFNNHLLVSIALEQGDFRATGTRGIPIGN
ncbi:MAG: hypothetical protein WBL20_07060 [Sphingobium sp.]|uniref:hypothetical protein n=1 Tax=Sphingobium sp. TaxID=1912891 RepID=UPI002E1D29BF